MKKVTKNMRTDALPHDGKTWAAELIAGSDYTNAMLASRGIDISKDTECIDAVRKAIVMLVDGGFEHFFGHASVKQVFIYSEDVRDRVPALNDSDGVCYLAKKDNPNCLIGLCERAVRDNRDYMLGVLLHELAHGIIGYDDKDHGFAFYVLLDSMTSEVNASLGTDISPDYMDMDPEDASRIMFARRNDGIGYDLESIRTRHNKRVRGN